MASASLRWIRSGLLCLGLVASTAATHAAGPAGIRIESLTAGESALEVWSQAEPLPPRVEVDLGVGENLDGRLLRVQPAMDPDAYRVFVQFETSMAIDGEGPHIDLVDWKHCRSEWRVAPRVDAGVFRLPAPHDSDHGCFPAATRAELQQAVRAALARHDFDPAAQERWLALAAQAPRPGESPSYVAISKVRVRIEHHSGGHWRALTTVDFNLPMGC